MHIVIITGPFLPPPPGPAGAVERVWHGLATEFARAGHRVTFLCRAPGPGLPPEETVDGVQFIRRAGPSRHPRTSVNLIRDLAYSWVMAGLVPRDAEIVVTNAFWLPLTVPLRRRGRMVVAPNLQRMPKGQLWLYRRAGHLLVVSEAVRGEVLAERPAAAGRVAVVPNPIDVSAFHPAGDKRSATGPPRLLYAGRLHPEKGLDLLLAAAHRLADAGRIFSLEIVGPWTVAEGGGGKEYRDHLQRIGAGLPVTWIEPVYDRHALARIYQRADVFCYPSRAERGETFGVAPLEAMACGLPTVVSDLACFLDYLKPGVNGLAFDHRGTDAASALAGAIARLVDSSSERQQMGSRAVATSGRYSYSAVAAEYLRLFHEWTGR